MNKHEIDLYARIFSMGKLHHAYTGTGAIATAVAANISQTIVADCLKAQIKDKQTLRIGHSAGTLEASASVNQINQQWVAVKASLIRTARTLMKGEVFLSE